MKHIGLLALALLVAPTLAYAQSAQNAPAQDTQGVEGGPPMAQQGAAPGGMRQMRAQMMQLRRETRSQMLGALTPQHRSLLASIVGQLAIAPAPDVRSAARQLDSALSPQESQAIVQAESAMHAQMHAGMQSAQNGSANSNANRPPATGQAMRTPDAGMALLHAALAVGGSMRPPHAL